MADEKGARRALNYDGHKFYDRKLRVSMAEKKAEIESELLQQRKTGDDFKRDKGAALKEEGAERRPRRREENEEEKRDNMDVRNRERRRSRSREDRRDRREDRHQRESRHHKDDV